MKKNRIIWIYKKLGDPLPTTTTTTTIRQIMAFNYHTSLYSYWFDLYRWTEKSRSSLFTLKIKSYIHLKSYITDFTLHDLFQCHEPCNGQYVQPYMCEPYMQHVVYSIARCTTSRRNPATNNIIIEKFTLLNRYFDKNNKQLFWGRIVPRPT